MQPREKIQLMEQFYTCFQQRDFAGMIGCYHPQIQFADPVFTDLKGKRACAMWHMLCERGTDLQVTFSAAHLHGEHGHIHWEADYTFSAAKRHVHNVIDATFDFADNKIIRHRDEFDLWRWTRMALGLPGALLGWTPLIQNKVRATARAGLDAFIAKHPEYQ
jgi:hypothetical protein